MPYTRMTNKKLEQFLFLFFAGERDSRPGRVLWLLALGCDPAHHPPTLRLLSVSLYGRAGRAVEELLQDQEGIKEDQVRLTDTFCVLE